MLPAIELAAHANLSLQSLMFMTIGRRAKSIFCMAAVMAAMTLPARGAVGDDADTAISVDQTIQALKDELVMFQRDAMQAEDEYLYPAASRVTVFVSNEIPGLLLKEISVSINGAAPVVHQYDEDDSRALLGKSTTQRLLRINLPQGAHRLRAQFVGRMAADKDKESAEPVSADGEFNFSKDLQASELELRIVKGPRRRSAPALQIREWRAVN